MKSLLIFVIWLPTTLATLIFSIGFFRYTEQAHSLVATQLSQQNQVSSIPYQIYTSIPRILGAKSSDSFAIKSQDVVPMLIYTYLKKYNSPMLETTNDLVLAARKNDIDPLLLVSIAQCESNLGKKMPLNADAIDSDNSCHNPFGWGIHSNGTLCFDTWQDGYEAISEGLSEKYKGLSTPEEIMTKYNTTSIAEHEGHWATCVNHFMEQLNELKNTM